MAARFMGKATNEVLVNISTRDKSLVTEKIDYDSLPSVVMKGMEKPVEVYRAVALIHPNYYEQQVRLAIDWDASSCRERRSRSSTRK